MEPVTVFSRCYVSIQVKDLEVISLVITTLKVSAHTNTYHKRTYNYFHFGCNEAACEIICISFQENIH